MASWKPLGSNSEPLGSILEGFGFDFEDFGMLQSKFLKALDLLWLVVWKTYWSHIWGHLLTIVGMFFWPLCHHFILFLSVPYHYIACHSIPFNFAPFHSAVETIFFRCIKQCSPYRLKQRWSLPKFVSIFLMLIFLGFWHNFFALDLYFKAKWV